MPSTVTRHIIHREPLLWEQGSPGRGGASLPPLDVPARDPAAELGALGRQQAAALPELSEVEVTRHFTRLSQWNHAIDLGLYPLGSCTMKYNPKVNEMAARLPGFATPHPYQPEETIQGALALLHGLERALCEISGLARASLQPAAGAHGELTGLMVMRAALADRGKKATKILIPDSAHGTNPASCTVNGFEVVPVKTNACGLVDVDAVRALAGADTAGIMITNPSTLGCFESAIADIAEIVHKAGGYVYMDGANLNALMGKFRPGDAGVDVMHINLHKTFSTPHGGGGPGAGPVACNAALEPFLPVPLVARDGDRYRLEWNRPKTIGRVRAFLGNWGVLVRAYAYIREMGGEGLTRATELAVLNANYLKARLADVFPVGTDSACLHEVVFSDRDLKKETGVQTLDVAKRLIDHGFHPPTIYFPLIVPGAMMFEPTETEPPEALDELVAAVHEIVAEARANPEAVKAAPQLTGIRRLDETRAARTPRLRWKPAK